MWDRAESRSLDALVGMAMRIIESRPAPPAWMVAPNFRTPETAALREPAAARSAAGTGPYRSVREVPRFS